MQAQASVRGPQITTASMLRMERETVQLMQEGNKRGFEDPMLVGPGIRIDDRRSSPGVECCAT